MDRDTFEDEHMMADYDVYDEYMDYEPSPYDGTYSEM